MRSPRHPYNRPSFRCVLGETASTRRSEQPVIEARLWLFPLSRDNVTSTSFYSLTRSFEFWVRSRFAATSIAKNPALPVHVTAKCPRNPAAKPPHKITIPTIVRTQLIQLCICVPQFGVSYLSPDVFEALVSTIDHVAFSGLSQRHSGENPLTCARAFRYPDKVSIG